MPINRLVDKKLVGDLAPADYPQNLVGSKPFYGHVAKGIESAPLTAEQRTALKRYTGPAYGPVNLYLRAGEDAVRKKYGPRGMVDVEAIARDAADAVRALPAPPANMVLFRGAMFNNIAELDALASAETVTAPSFTSTSRDPRVAVGFAGGMFGSDPSVVYRIRKHASGSVLAPPVSMEAESEVLFPPGSRFRVVGRQRVSESQLLLDLEEITE